MDHGRSQGTSWTKYDLIKRSQLLNDGQPARYRLITTRSNLDESGKIRKWTFGQREDNTQNKIILLVGETGTGKTSLINTIVNYTLRVKFEDHVWFEITEEREVDRTDDQAETRTTEITVYEVFAQDNPISVTIIDTPGFGDTEGAEYDRQIAEQLRKLFENNTGVKEIDAVCLVVKATENRLSDREDYVFDAVLSLFGKDIEENIVIFVTHSDGSPPENVLNRLKRTDIPSKKDGTDPIHFLFNNHQKEQWTPKYEKVYRNAWKLTEDNLNDFFASLENQSRKSLEKTESVLKEQIQLKACVSNLRECIEIKEHKHEELTQIQEALKKKTEEIQKNENFSHTFKDTHKEKVTIENASWWDRKATCCSLCEENCHECCWCAISPKWCEVMKDGHCTVCKEKCHHSKHIREDKKYVTNYEEVTITKTSLIKEISLDTSIENGLKAELTKIKNEKTRLVEEVYNSIMKLSEIALKPDSAFMIECLDFLILRANDQEDRVQKLKKLKEIDPETQRRVDAVLGYMKRSPTKGTYFEPTAIPGPSSSSNMTADEVTSLGISGTSTLSSVESGTAEPFTPCSDGPAAKVIPEAAQSSI